MPETVFDKNTGISTSCSVRVTSLYRAERVLVVFYSPSPLAQILIPYML